jgi:hypothetical protein
LRRFDAACRQCSRFGHPRIFAARRRRRFAGARAGT